MIADGVGIMDSDACDEAAQTLITGLLNMNMVNRNWREHAAEIKVALANYGQANRIIRHLQSAGAGQDDKVLAFTKVYMYCGADIPGAIKQMAINAANNEYSWAAYGERMEDRKLAMKEFISDLENYELYGTPVALEYVAPEDRITYGKKRK